MNIIDKAIREQLYHFAVYVADYLSEENIAEIESSVICRAVDDYLADTTD